jgi:hypothetical protein
VGAEGKCCEKCCGGSGAKRVGIRLMIGSGQPLLIC